MGVREQKAMHGLVYNGSVNDFVMLILYYAVLFD